MTQSADSPAAVAAWVPDDSTFGARLALIRQHMKWSNVAQAARQCGVPADSWRNWEEGMEPRRIVTIAMAIATRTGVDLNWLVYGPNRGAMPLTPNRKRGIAERVLPRQRSSQLEQPDTRRSVSQTRPVFARLAPSGH